MTQKAALAKPCRVTHLYHLDAPAADFAAALDAAPGRDPWQGGYLTPGQFAPVVVHGREGRIVRPLFWGFPPPPRGDNFVPFVRNLESPFWIGNLRHTSLRCLIPATSFSLWSTAPDGRRVQQRIGLPDGGVFAIAGTWRDTTDAMHFAMLLTDACPIVSRLGGASMPVILPRGDQDAWMQADWKEAKDLVRPYWGQMVATDPRTSSP